MTTVTKARKPAPRSQGARRQATVNDDRCLLCGASSQGSYRSDLAHIRKAHPDYARGLLLRVGSPLVFVALLGVLATLHAPNAAFFVALAACVAIFVTGIFITRSARGLKASGGPASLLRLLKEGGWRFVIIPVAIVSLILLGRR